MSLKSIPNSFIFCDKTQIVFPNSSWNLHAWTYTFTQWKFLKDIYAATYNLCFPLKKLKPKQKVLRRPWFQKGLSKSVRKKNLSYKNFLSHPNPHNEVVYKHYKNKLDHSIIIAKSIIRKK